MKCALPGMYGKPIPRLNVQSNSVADSYSEDLEMISKESMYYLGRGSSKSVNFEQAVKLFDKEREMFKKTLKESIHKKIRDQEMDLQSRHYVPISSYSDIQESSSMIEKFKQELLQKDREEHSQENQSL